MASNFSINASCRSLTVIVMALLFLLSQTPAAAAQEVATDSCNTTQSTDATSNPYKFKWQQLAIPSAIIATSIWATSNDWFDNVNSSTRDELQEHIDTKFTYDDYAQYLPMASMWALKACGVKSKHNAREMFIINATAAAIMGITTNSMKYSWQIRRPDGSSANSFPSGHTALAFMGAELLREEYWETSPLIGASGYLIASGVGFFRMYNNRHWLSDVICGVGVGILSVRAAYWLYPTIARLVAPNTYSRNVYLFPYASTREAGLSVTMNF